MHVNIKIVTNFLLEIIPLAVIIENRSISRCWVWEYTQAWNGLMGRSVFLLQPNDSLDNWGETMSCRCIVMAKVCIWMAAVEILQLEFSVENLQYISLFF